MNYNFTGIGRARPVINLGGSGTLSTPSTSKLTSTSVRSSAGSSASNTNPSASSSSLSRDDDNSVAAQARRQRAQRGLDRARAAAALRIQRAWRGAQGRARALHAARSRFARIAAELEQAGAQSESVEQYARLTAALARALRAQAAGAPAQLGSSAQMIQRWRALGDVMVSPNEGQQGKKARWLVPLYELASSSPDQAAAQEARAYLYAFTRINQQVLRMLRSYPAWQGVGGDGRANSSTSSTATSNAASSSKDAAEREHAAGILLSQLRRLRHSAQVPIDLSPPPQPSAASASASTSKATSVSAASSARPWQHYVLVWLLQRNEWYEGLRSYVLSLVSRSVYTHHI